MIFNISTKDRIVYFNEEYEVDKFRYTFLDSFRIGNKMIPIDYKTITREMSQIDSIDFFDFPIIEN